MTPAATLNATNPLLNDPALESNLDWEHAEVTDADENPDVAEEPAAGTADRPTESTGDAAVAAGVAGDPGKGGEEPTKEKTAVKEEVKDAKPPAGYVPHGALHEERQRRKDLEAEIQKMNERFQQVLDRLAPGAAKPEPQGPNYDDDPIGYVHTELQKTREVVSKIEQERQADQQARTAQEQQAVVARQVAGMVQQYIGEHPDYPEAYQYVQARRRADLETMGVAPADIAQVLEAEAGWLMSTALAQNRNPAEIVHQMAQKWGYQAKATAASGKDAATEKLETIERGMERSKSLGAGTSAPNLQDLAQMDEDEFDLALKEIGFKG
jgi:hypothetical protein